MHEIKGVNYIRRKKKKRKREKRLENPRKTGKQEALEKRKNSTM